MDARLKELTKEELEILNLACDGKSSEEIAAVLGMTHGAFQKNAQAINRKLGIENLPEVDRKREIHRLCAAIAALQSGRGRSVVRRDPDSRKRRRRRPAERAGQFGGPPPRPRGSDL